MDKRFSLRAEAGCPVKRTLLLCFGVLCISACGDFTLFGSGEEVTPTEPPEAAASVSPASVAACETATVTLDGTGSTGEDLTYGWAFTEYPEQSKAADWSSAASKPSFKPDRAGSYKVKLTVSNAAGSATDEKSFTASSAPIALAVADPEQVVVGTTGTLDGSGSKNPNPTAPGDVCTSADLDFLWSLKDPSGAEANGLLGSTRNQIKATISPVEGTTPGIYTATLKLLPSGKLEPVGTATVSVTVSPSLEELDGGSYAFVVKEQVQDTVFGGFGLLLPVGTPLPEEIHVPGVHEVPFQDRLLFAYEFLAYTITGGVNLEIERAQADDPFYTLLVPDGETAGSVNIAGTSTNCTVAFGQMAGSITPQTTRKVTLALKLTEVTTTGGLCAQLGLGAPSPTGSIDLTLEGTCQDCGV